MPEHLSDRAAPGRGEPSAWMVVPVVVGVLLLLLLGLHPPAEFTELFGPGRCPARRAALMTAAAEPEMAASIPSSGTG